MSQWVLNYYFNIHRKAVELDTSKFDKALEEFYSICDLMELNLVSEEIHMLCSCMCRVEYVT
jgi:hypothetical protein